MKAIAFGALGLLLTPVISIAQHFGPGVPLPNTSSSVAVGISIVTAWSIS
jgi:hypothetical protein